MALHPVCVYDHGRTYSASFGIFVDTPQLGVVVPYSIFLASFVTILTSVNASPAFRPPRLEGTLHTPRIYQLTGADTLHLFVSYINLHAVGLVLIIHLGTTPPNLGHLSTI
jgi:hypothetical protein